MNFYRSSSCGSAPLPTESNGRHPSVLTSPSGVLEERPCRPSLNQISQYMGLRYQPFHVGVTNRHGCSICTELPCFLGSTLLWFCWLGAQRASWVIRQRRDYLELYVEHARQVWVVERHEPGDGNEQHDTETPRVRQHRVVRSTPQHFGRHIGRAAAVRRTQHSSPRRLHRTTASQSQHPPHDVTMGGWPRQHWTRRINGFLHRDAIDLTLLAPLESMKLKGHWKVSFFSFENYCRK